MKNEMKIVQHEKYRMKPDIITILGGDALGEFLLDFIIALNIQFDPGPMGNPELKKLLDKYPKMFERVE